MSCVKWIVPIPAKLGAVSLTSQQHPDDA